MAITTKSRKGPRKVWMGYRNLRVPIEIFNDVRNFMEMRKEEFLKDKDGYVETEDNTLSPFEKRIIKIIKDTISNELGTKTIPLQIEKSKKSSNSEVRKGTSKDQILQLLKERKGTELSTTEINKLLNLPEATGRQAARELADENPNVIKIAGRPNKFIYLI